MKETDHHEQGNSQKKQLAIPSTPLKVVDQGSGRNVAVSMKKLSRYQLFRRLLSFISPDLPRIAVGLLALTVNSITNLSFPWILGRALDNAATENLQEFLLNSAGFFLAGSVASWIRIYCLGTATENISNRLKSLLFKSILFQEMEYYETTPLGEVVSLLENDIQASSELFTEKIAGGLRSFNSAVNGSFVLYNTSPYLCGVTLSVVPVVGIAAMTLSRYSRRLTNQLRELHSAIYSYSLERYQNISTVRLNNRESFEIEKFSQKLEESKDCSTKRHHTYGLFMSFVNLSTNCSLIAVLRVGGGMIARGELTVGQLTSFAIQSGFVGLGFSGLSTLYSDITRALDSAERIFNVVDRAEENLVSSYRSVKGEECFTPTSKLYDDATIRVQDLSFSYKSRHDVRVLDDVSLSIQKNQISCIVGKSGSGKSTLAALLCGLYHPDSGKIIYGQNKNHLRVYADEKLSPEKVQLLHDLFGVVEQSSTTLFSGTIGENIAYGNLNANQEEIESAARDAHAHDFIKDFPDGYATQVGEKGCLLSGGQRARIALARALVKKPTYLLLDEPTAALDADSEKELIPPLLSLKERSTIILFTHSDALKNISDVIFSLESGRLRL